MSKDIFCFEAVVNLEKIVVIKHEWRNCQMNNHEIYKQIEEHIKGRKFDDNNELEIAGTKSIIYNLLNGNKEKLSQERKLGCYIKDPNTMTDSELLVAVLQSCSEEVLLGLEKEFGKNSKISKLIRDEVLKDSQTQQISNEETITTLENMLKESEKLNYKLYSLICKYMSEKGYKSDADFYNSIFMSRQNFARIRNKSANIGKDCILWIVCGLGLNYIEAYQVLNAAGYTFKSNDKRDVVISYIMKNVPDYTFDMVNDVLYHFNLRTFLDE